MSFNLKVFNFNRISLMEFILGVDLNFLTGHLMRGTI